MDEIGKVVEAAFFADFGDIQIGGFEKKLGVLKAHLIQVVYEGDSQTFFEKLHKIGFAHGGHSGGVFD